MVEWHRASPENRKALTVQRQIDKPNNDVDMGMENDVQRGDQVYEDGVRVDPDGAIEEDANEQPTGILASDDRGTLPHSAVVTGAISAEEHVQEVLRELERPPDAEEDSEIKEEHAGVDLSGFREIIEPDADGDGDQDADGDDNGDDGDEFRQEANLLSMINDESVRPEDASVIGMDVDPVTSQAKARNQRLKALRAPLLDKVNLSSTVIDLKHLSLVDPVFDNQEKGSTGLLTYDPVKLPDLFPDLVTFGPFMSRDDSKGKPDKRVDETTNLGKVTYTSRLMDIKPVLLSTLQPGEKRRHGEWVDLGEFYPAEDSNTELKPTEFYMPSPPGQLPLKRRDVCGRPDRLTSFL